MSSSTNGSLQIQYDEICGCEVSCTKSRRRLRFPFLQFFATPKFALVFLSCAGVAQGFVVSGLYSVVVTTLEKRFHLHSTETGFIASSYDIASCITVLFITYFGGKGHKALWIGWGVFIFGIGSILFSLPHFLAPTYTIGQEQHNLCNSFLSHSKCFPSKLRNFMAVFVIAQLLQGSGGTTLFTLGVTYLDENVEQIKSSLYHGVYYSSAVIGPALGFILGGSFLTVYTDIGKSVDIHNSSPLWIGAWWLGFLVGGITIMLIAFPIMMLPHQLPGTSHVRVNREGEMHYNQTDTKYTSSSTARFSDFGWSILVLLRNPTFVFITLAGSLDANLVMGISTFGPKYIESMFNISASQAALYFGILVILAGTGGQFFGGLLITKMKMSVKGILRFCVLCSILAFATCFIFLQTCPDTAFAGSTVKYVDAPTAETLSSRDHKSQCNSRCACNPDLYDPVCGEDGITYFSPCFAGCNTKTNHQEYTNCSCVAPYNGSSTHRVTSGKCDNRVCGSLNLFLVFFFVSILGTFLASTPAIQAILRVVPFQQRSFAIGLKFVFVRLLGSIPGPILFGRVLDLACAVWSTECGKSGSCELYRSGELAAHMTAMGAVIKAAVTLCFIAAYLVYKQPPQGALERLDEVTLNGTFERNPIDLPTTHSASGAVSEILRARVNKFDGISYQSLREEISSSAEVL